MGKLATMFNVIGLGIKKHSPELLVAASGIGTVAAVVLACKATTKAGVILEEHKQQIEQIHEVQNDKEFSEEYTDKDYKKDLTIVYSNTFLKLGKLYAPTILMTAGALFCMFASVSILKKRNAALASTCAALLSSFSNYRQRVKDRFGEDVEWEIANDIHEVEETVVKTDKKGNEKEVTEKRKLPGGTASPFAFVFDPSNPNWTGDRELDLCWLTAQLRYQNDRLYAEKLRFNNDIWADMGFPRTQEGAMMGFIYCKDNPNGDNYIDFGINKDSVNFRDWYSGKNDFIILELNSDGYIYDKLPSCKGSGKRNN